MMPPQDPKQTYKTKPGERTIKGKTELPYNCIVCEKEIAFGERCCTTSYRCTSCGKVKHADSRKAGYNPPEPKSLNCCTSSSSRDFKIPLVAFASYRPTHRGSPCNLRKGYGGTIKVVFSRPVQDADTIFHGKPWYMPNLDGHEVQGWI
jgi:hypothetical protein